MAKTIDCDVVVLGAGPGGYTAAFRAADLGKKVVLIEKENTLGGVCLNVGCIPSKALLHAAKVIDEAEYMSQHGIAFNKPKIDNNKLRAWKNDVIGKLTGGLSMLAKQRKVEVVSGEGQFASANSIEVKGKENTVVNFAHAIIAAGSRPVQLPFIPEDRRIMDSTSALELEETNCKMLIIGGGIIGLEMATVYHALGAEIHIVEFMNQLMPGADADIVKPLAKRLEKQYKTIMLETKVTAVDAKKDGVYVTFEGKAAPAKAQRFDRVLVAVGRTPNGKLIAADKASVNVDERGFIHVDNQLRTNVPHIFAIGDIVGQPMLAHKAHAEAPIAAEVIAGKKHYFDPRCIPSVAYTDPEVAWTGLTEHQAKAEGIDYGKGVFPWAANGRSLAVGRSEGLTKILFDKSDNRIIGASIVGPNAGELIAELSLAIEMACDAEDVALTIHPHPTLSETVALAVEAYTGSITDLYMPRATK
ncbi:MAG: dihydrolipoyl dehydrogenase [Pseudomonadota bacterium]